MKTTVGNHGYGRYYVVDENKGIKLPSVTTILGETKDKSGLLDWQNRVGAVEAERISTFSANRGTFMHALHEQYINCLYVTKESKPLQQAFIKAKAMKECANLTTDEIEMGKKLFLQFLNTTDFYERMEDVMYQEIPLWSFISGGYAGRMDLSMWAKSRIPKLVDFKTSRKPKKEEWIEDYKLQTSAYSVALHERYGIFPQSVEIWISCESGEVQLFELDRKAIKENFEKFNIRLKQYHEKFK